MTARDPWAADVAIDATIARAAIEGQFPHLAAAEIVPFGEGWDNAAFLVGGRYVFRFPRRRVAVPLIETELRVLPVLARRLPLPVPLPRFAGVPGETFAYPFAGYERLAGEALTHVRLRESAYGPLATALGDFLRTLHAIAPEALPELPGDTIGRFAHARLLPLLTHRLDELRAAGAIADPAPALVAFQLLAPGAPRNDRSSVVHGDLYARHLLVDGAQRASGVIDWGDVHLGDPAIDLSVAYSIFPPEFRQTFARAYGKADERTWELARYRAIYSSALLAHYGHKIGDAAITRAGLDGLSRSV